MGCSSPGFPLPQEQQRGGSAVSLPVMFRISPTPATNLIRLDQLSWPGNGLRKAVSSHTLFSNGKASSREWVKRRWGCRQQYSEDTLFSRGPATLAAPSRDASHISRGSTLRLFCVSWLATATENVPPEGTKLLWSELRRLQSPHLSGLLGGRVGIMVQSGCF